MNNRRSSTRRVFQSLADLQKLTTAPDLNQIEDRLRSSLRNYAELEFRSDAKRLDLITLSREPAVLTRFFALLKKRGFAEDAFKIPQALVNLANGRVIGMKLPIAGPLQSGELYVRGATPLDAVAMLLSTYGVPDSSLLAMREVGNLLGKKHVHMLAADIGEPQFTVFFTLYLTEENSKQKQQQLVSAMSSWGIEPHSIDRFLPLHRLWGRNRPKTIYVSLPIDSQTVLGRLKVDYANVPLQHVSKGMHLISDTNQIPAYTQWGTQWGIQTANYAGVIVNKDKPVSIRAYFTRKF